MNIELHLPRPVVGILALLPALWISAAAAQEIPLPTVTR